MPDYSSYPRAQQANLLAQVGQLIGIQQGLNQNQLFQQEFADRAAQNRAYQAGMDPATGQIDYNKVGQNLTQGGFGRLLPQVYQQLQEQQNRQLGIDTAQLGLALKRSEAMAGGFASLLSDPNLDKQKVIQKAASLIGQGLTTPQQVAGFLSNLPDDPNGMRQFLQQGYIQHLNSAEKLKALTATPQMVDTGGAILPVDVNPITNPGITSQAIPKTLSPEAATAPTPALVRNPDGTLSPSTITRAQFAQQAQGGPIATAPALTAGGLTPAEAAGTVDITGPDGQKYTISKAQFMGMVGGAPGQRGAAGGQGVPGVPSGPKPGQMEAAGVAATEAAKAAADAFQTASTAPARLFQLEQTAAALSNPKVETGPGSDTVNTIKSFLLNYGGKYVTDANAIKDFESANKYLVQYATGQAGNLGSGTDAKLAAAFTGNPNTSLSKLAVQDLVKSAIGLERMNQAVALAWNSSGLPPEDFNKWRVQYLKDLDPTVFVIDKLPRDRQEKIVREVAANPESKKSQSFFKSYNAAVDNGLIQRLP